MERARIRLAAGLGAALLALAGWWLLGSPSETPERAPRGTAPPASNDGTVDGPAAAPAPAAEPPIEEAPLATASTGIRGTVVDAGGAPIEGATVRVGALTRATDAAGQFAMRTLAWSGTGSAGTLLASKEGHGTAQVDLLRGGPRELRVVLPIAAEIAGVVTGPEGPIGGARVVLHDGAWERAVETDAGGAFRFPEARSTWCELVATARDHRPAGVRVPGGIERRLVRILLNAESHEFALRVEDAEGRPVAGAEVAAHYEGASAAVVHRVTDATGFALPLPRNPRLRVSVEAAGFGPGGASLPWRIEEDFVVTLHREADLEVRAAATMDPAERESWAFALGWNYVRDPNAPASEWNSGSEDDRTGAVHHDRWERFDDEGRARMRGARVGGAYSIVAQRRDRRGVTQSFRVIAWKTANLPAGSTVVEWAPPGLVPVAVRIEDESSGTGIVGLVRFEADAETHAAHRDRTAERRWAASVRTGSDGAATIWVWPGRYRVTGYGGRGISHEPQSNAQVEIGAEGASVTLKLVRGTVVRGRLRTADGTPLPRRQVHLNSDPKENGIRLLLGADTDDEGRFEVFHVPDGPYSVWAQGIRMELMAPDPPRITAPCGEVDLVVTGCTLRGDIRPAPDGPATVRVQQANGGGPVEETLDDAGAFEVRGLSPGPKTVVVYGARGEMLGTAQVVVADGTFVTVVRVPPPGPEAR